ncbi:OmpH family outer membrane protein, partial [Acidobacteria bacterium AH-259-D05]|nr:OmpH family outer membrane protein [Acidobacteria bacterium AH-259-D05]
SQGVKIGFVDSRAVLLGTEEGKAEIEQLNQFAAGKEQEFASETTALQKLQEQYAAQQLTLNPETRAEMEREITDRDLKLKRLQEDIQLELSERQNNLLARMSEKIQLIINDFAPQNGYGVIFLRNETQTYVDGQLDITPEIVRIYNERHPVAGAQ